MTIDTEAKGDLIILSDNGNIRNLLIWVFTKRFEIEEG